MRVPFPIALAMSLYLSPAAARAADCAGCHPDPAAKLSTSRHAALACATCHEGADAHALDPARRPAVHFDLELCGGCHGDQYASYIHDEPVKTPYGGGVEPPNAWPKTRDFPYYNVIIDGYGFVKDYNEERAHKWLLADHKDVTRFKYETCLQCKSTKVAYYWDAGTPRTIRRDVAVTAGHFTGTVTIPAGTTVSMATDRVTPLPATGQPNHEVKVLVTLPSGKRYASWAYPFATTGVDPDPAVAREARIWTWAAVYALFVENLAEGSPTVDAGVGCNHCHDPHATAPRIVRKSLAYAIARKGVNPYASRKTYSFEAARRQDQLDTLCAQCHVEYVCGNSAVDRYDRDFFPWAKVGDLDALYRTTFAYNQDWRHGTGVRPWQSVDPALAGYYPPGALFPIGETLVKSQHPETETFWNSGHYQDGASCVDCHMPKAVGASGRTYTSHWFTSPVKLLGKGVNPCAACHPGESAATKLDQIATRQGGIFRLQEDVQRALVDSLRALSAAKAAGRDVSVALEFHRRAHLRWENLVVSENSMGFHDWDGVERELETARSEALTAASLVR